MSSSLVTAPRVRTPSRAFGVRVIFWLSVWMTGWVLTGCRPEPIQDDRASGEPDAWIWAWDRPEDLSFLAATSAGDREIGVAALVATVTLRQDEERGRSGFDVQVRRHSIVLPDEVRRWAVVRIENARPPVRRLDASTEARLVAALAELSARFGAEGLQIDFDALASQRAMYRRLLGEVSTALQNGRQRRTTRLSITALASWCLGDPWIDDLPVDVAVPMFFRMGPEAQGIRRLLQRGVERSFDSRADLCRDAVGTSTDETWPELRALPGTRWIFHPTPWTPASVAEVQSRRVVRDP